MSLCSIKKEINKVDQSGPSVTDFMQAEIVSGDHAQLNLF